MDTTAYYIDCPLTTIDPEGAWLVGQLMHSLIRKEQAARKLTVNAVGGLTMGAGHAALHIRFGPKATATKEKPVATKPHP